MGGHLTAQTPRDASRETQRRRNWLILPGQDKPELTSRSARQSDFQNQQLLLALLIEVRAARGLQLRIVGRDLLQEGGGLPRRLLLNESLPSSDFTSLPKA